MNRLPASAAKMPASSTPGPTIHTGRVNHHSAVGSLYKANPARS